MTLATSEWGVAGVEALREDVDVLVIVDVLSFSTAVDVAVSRGVAVYPYSSTDRAAAQVVAERIGAVLAQPRDREGDAFSLSPSSLMTAPAGMKLMLPSPNGSRLSLASSHTPIVAGCLRNARAVAARARALAGDGEIGVVPAGERWPDGSLRPAIEDLLAAGAILHHLDVACSPEARVARDAYRSAGLETADLVRESISGRELIDGGFPEDVEMAVAENVSTQVPLMTDGAYQAA